MKNGKIPKKYAIDLNLFPRNFQNAYLSIYSDLSEIVKVQI